METPCSAKNSQTTVKSESELEEYSPSSDESVGGFHIPEKKVENTHRFDLDVAMARYRAQLARRERRQPECGEGGRDKPASSSAPSKKVSERRQPECGEGGRDKPASTSAPSKKVTLPKRKKTYRRRTRAPKEPASKSQ